MMYVGSYLMVSLRPSTGFWTLPSVSTARSKSSIGTTAFGTHEVKFLGVVGGLEVEPDEVPYIRDAETRSHGLPVRLVADPIGIAVESEGG